MRDSCFPQTVPSPFEVPPRLLLGLPPGQQHQLRIPTAGERLHAAALALATNFQPPAASDPAAARALNIPMPGERPGFSHRLVHLTEGALQLVGALGVDPRAVTAILDVNQNCSALAAYRDKLPLMALNVSRLHYTIEAFVTLRRTVDGVTPTQQALRFLLETDRNYAHRDPRQPPNERFSQMLHRLAANGYEAYIFELAAAVRANVDLVVGDVSRVVGHRYRLLRPASCCDRPTATTTVADERDTGRCGGCGGTFKDDSGPPAGFITALTDTGDTWCVKTTAAPFFENDDPDDSDDHAAGKLDPHHPNQR